MLTMLHPGFTPPPFPQVIQIKFSQGISGRPAPAVPGWLNGSMQWSGSGPSPRSHPHGHITQHKQKDLKSTKQMQHNGNVYAHSTPLHCSPVLLCARLDGQQCTAKVKT